MRFLRIFLAAILLAPSLTVLSWTQETNTQETNTKEETNTKDKTAKFETKTDETKSQPDVVKRLDNSASVLNEIMETPDKGIPTDVFADAKCIIVVPSMIHIAVGFGGRHGKGVSTCRTANGWSAPAPISITGGSWGLQLGGKLSI